MVARSAVTKGVLAVASVLLAGAAVLSSRGNAETPFIDEAIAATSARLDYNVSQLVPVIDQQAAIRQARAFVGGTAVVRSARLAYYSNLQRTGMLVWVVDADGLNWRAAGGGSTTPLASRPSITRAGVLVSATDGHVELMFTFVPPKP